MKLTILGIIFVAVAAVFALQTGSAQTPAEPIKVRGCLQGDGSDANPWSLRRVTLPAPPAAQPAGGGGGGGRGAAPAGGGGRGGDGRGGGAAAGQGAPAGGGAAGRGGDGRGAAPAAPAPAPTLPPVDLRLTGIDLTPWRQMFVEVEGTLGPAAASGMREFRMTAARSAYGDCR